MLLIKHLVIITSSHIANSIKAMGSVEPICQAYKEKFQFYFNCSYRMDNSTHCTSDWLSVYTVTWSMGTTVDPKLTQALKFILAQKCGLFEGKHQNVCLLQIHVVKLFISGMGALFAHLQIKICK